MLLTKQEGVLTVKDAKGNPIAVVYKDTESASKHCIFYGLQEMSEDEIASLLSQSRS